MHKAHNNGSQVHINISQLSSAQPCSIYTLLTLVFEIVYEALST